MRTRAILFLITGALVAAACESPVDGDLFVCPLSLTITPSSATLAVGDTIRFHAADSCHLYPQNGPFQFRSNDTTIATVSLDGLARGQAAGTAIITGVAVHDTTRRVAAALTVTR